MIQNAKWIWTKHKPKKNEFVSFLGRFEFNGKALLNIASETNYIAYINGKRVAFGQFAGYRDQKYYDIIDISDCCINGSNELKIVVRYEGIDSATHIDDGAGLIFTVENEKGNVILASNAAIESGYDMRYLSGEVRSITPQLGIAVSMRNHSGIEKTDTAEYSRACRLLPRPVRKLTEEAVVFANAISVSGRKIYDIGRETAGYVVLKVKATHSTKVKVAYGEHINDGKVRYLIGNRDFSLDFYCTEGINEFEQLFVRIAGRYFEIFCDEDTEILQIGIIPVMYPLTVKTNTMSGIDKQIYDVCVRTLRLCMHEHYEDCPWREQALYILDSRNQMLCGYYAFKETDFQRANLVFMSKGTREDGLFELTYPAVNTPAIPFFSLMYPVALYEYVKHTEDTSILSETEGAADSILRIFGERIDDNGLIADLPKPYWNFYEWTTGSDGMRSLVEGEKAYDLILNCAFVYAVNRYNKLLELINAPKKSYGAEKVKKAIERDFYDDTTGLFRFGSANKELYTALGNAFALLIGLGDKRTAQALKNGANLVPATLSMIGFVYDALLEADKNNKDYVLENIRSTYTQMLNAGATSVWETENGDSDFDNAGSLCHGWSALPIYYYNLLIKEKNV